MQRTGFGFITAALFALLTSSTLAADAAAKSYVVTDENLGKLRADFNANVGKVRTLHIVGPTCGVCLRGLSDTQESLYSRRATIRGWLRS